MSSVRAWIGRAFMGGAVGHVELDRLREKVLFDREPVAPRYGRFVVLLTLATIIATGGVIVDSTASVIGAMIVAPLMTPIMALALSVTTGDRSNIVRSALIVAIATAFAVALAFVLTKLLPGGVDTATNPQVLGRTTVGLIELGLALASGAAGAFGLMREDVSDALPGVAIAISLVPPLSVVGICLAVGSYDQAGAAFLLFVTNCVAILVAGGLLFAIAGYGRAAFAAADARSRRFAAIAIALSLVVLLSPLAHTTYVLSTQAIVTREITPAVDAFLLGSGYQKQSLSVEGTTANLVIVGIGELPDLAALPDFVEESTGRVLTMDMRVVPLQRVRAEP
jgi:uncharacterized hydrophobic protein (TIGR00271 family)